MNSTLPFDPAVLAHKLEAHRQAQDYQQHDQKTRHAPHRAYVPRDAARQFAATTSILDADKALTHPALRPRVKHDSARNSMFVPKHMQIGLSMGLSESEVLAATSFESARRRASDNDGSVPLEFKSHRRIVRDQALSDTSSSSASSCSGRSEHIRSDDKPRRGQDKTSPAQNFYRPGDAAKRKMDKRRAYAMPPLDGIVLNVTAGHDRAHILVDDSTCQHPSQISRHGPAIEMPYDMAMPLRPKLAGHDRHNWAQASQCGESFSKYVQSCAPNNPALSDPSVPSNQPSSATGNVPVDGKLVSDAVRLIKDGEKLRRRQSIRGFFKRT